MIQESRSRPEIFAQLFDRHFASLFQFCSRRVGSTTAEDVVGETFRRAFENREQFDTSRPNAGPWLMTIALNIIRNEHRRSQRESSAIAGMSVQPEDHELPEGLVVGSLDAEKLLSQVQACLSRLGDVEYEALTLYVWDELSYDEIAEITDVPLGTVRSRIHRARQRLQEALEATHQPSEAPLDHWR